MPGGLRTARHCIFTDGAWTARGGCRACFLWKRRRSGGRARPLSLAPLGSSPKGRALGMAARFPVSPEPLPLGEVSPQVIERVPSREKVDRENPQIFPIYKL